jgi:hypothetical protein
VLVRYHSPASGQTNCSSFLLTLRKKAAGARAKPVVGLNIGALPSFGVSG